MTDAFTKKVMKKVNASGLDRNAIAAKAGVEPRTLRNWDNGRSNATPFLGECVLEAVDILLARVDKDKRRA